MKILQVGHSHNPELTAVAALVCLLLTRQSSNATHLADFPSKIII